MKIAVIYNRESQKVINLFGVANREKYGLAAIRRIVDALKSGGHQTIALEGDKDLIDNLEDFMPRALKGERPGMAFNLSYGIQGQARYTHVPGILEMVGVPYVGSGPLAHSLALDKVVAKMLFVQNGVPTPEFAVLEAPGFDVPDLEFPLIVKPKNEAVSFGIRIVGSEEELREASDVIFEQFDQAVLAERYIESKEINVGLLGNGTNLETFPPAELVFGTGGPNIYTLEDKKRESGREIQVICPARIDESAAHQAREIAKRAFNVLGCYDCARVDMRMDEQGRLYVLEINSLPSLGEHGSYVAAAEAIGLDFTALVNRLAEVAAARYFGTPNPQLGMEHFHRDPEWLFGEGIGSSRAPLTMMEYGLRALKHARRLSRMRLGVSVYADEGRDCEESVDMIRRACSRAGRVLVLNAGLAVPPEVARLNQLTPAEVSQDGDEGAREVYAALESEVAHFITADVARAFVDLNRAEHDIRKDGVVKTHTCWDVPIYSAPLTPELIETLLERYHRPYHERLTALAGTTGLLLGVDSYTMAAKGPPIGPDPGAERPQVCLSNADGTCPRRWIESLQACFQHRYTRIGNRQYTVFRRSYHALSRSGNALGTAGAIPRLLCRRGTEIPLGVAVPACVDRVAAGSL